MLRLGLSLRSTPSWRARLARRGPTTASDADTYASLPSGTASPPPRVASTFITAFPFMSPFYVSTSAHMTRNRFHSRLIHSSTTRSPCLPGRVTQAMRRIGTTRPPPPADPAWWGPGRRRDRVGPGPEAPPASRTSSAPCPDPGPTPLRKAQHTAGRQCVRCGGSDPAPGRASVYPEMEPPSHSVGTGHIRPKNMVNGKRVGLRLGTHRIQIRHPSIGTPVKNLPNLGQSRLSIGSLKGIPEQSQPSKVDHK